MTCTCTALPNCQPAAHAPDCPVFKKCAAAIPLSGTRVGPGNVSRGKTLPRHRELEELASSIDWDL